MHLLYSPSFPRRRESRAKEATTTLNTRLRGYDGSILLNCPYNNFMCRYESR